MYFVTQVLVIRVSSYIHKVMELATANATSLCDRHVTHSVRSSLWFGVVFTYSFVVMRITKRKKNTKQYTKHYSIRGSSYRTPISFD